MIYIPTAIALIGTAYLTTLAIGLWVCLAYPWQPWAKVAHKHSPHGSEQ